MISVPQLCFQVAELPAQGKTVEGSVDFDALDPGDDGRLQFPYPLHFRLVIAPVQQGILVRGTLDTVVRAPCDRCLCDVDVPVRVDDACYHFEEMPVGVLDLTEPVREDILLVLPQGCLCRDDCRGLCPSCGQNLNEGTCSCPASGDDDSPWGALDRLDLP
jgi:uncharacterized protein